jgi:hypothetical protein
MGVLRAVDAPIYEEQAVSQLHTARQKSGAGNFDNLFASGDTWVVD